MTDEYIRKEDVLKGKRTGTFPNGICMEAKACVTIEYIKSIPPADVVPVVRCKDCKHDISSQFDTAARCNLWGCLKPKKGFCDAGKRREE